jgi:hypothetical protein
MTDDQHIRSLLMAATELPDDLLPPVQRLIRLGHQRRNLRTRLRAVSVAAVAVVAVVTPPIIRAALVPARPAPSNSIQSGPSAAEISKYHWSTRHSSPLGPRSNPIVVWAGRELIELDGALRGRPTPAAAAFDAATGRWHKIAPLPASLALDYPATAWTGRWLFFVGEHATCVPTCLRQAGLYDPATNRWTTTVLPRAMDGLFRLTAVWTGHEIILAASDSSRGRLGVASYNPSAGRWKMITPALPARHPARFVAMVAAPHRVILWSLWAREKFTRHGRIISPGVDVLALGPAGTWRNVTGHWPQNQTVESPVFTGRTILVSPGQLFCGVGCSPHFAVLPGYFADPATLRRTLIPTGPLAESVPAYIWTGRTIIAVNLAANIPPPHPLALDSMALYDPATNTWTHLPATPGHPSLAATPVWTGTELLALTDSGQLLAFTR